MAYYCRLRQSSGNRNRNAERAGAVGHALIEGDQRRTEPLRVRDVKCVESAKRQIEPPQERFGERNIRRIDVGPG